MKKKQKSRKNKRYIRKQMKKMYEMVEKNINIKVTGF